MRRCGPTTCMSRASPRASWSPARCTPTSGTCTSTQSAERPLQLPLLWMAHQLMHPQSSTPPASPEELFVGVARAAVHVYMLRYAASSIAAVEACISQALWRWQSPVLRWVPTQSCTQHRIRKISPEASGRTNPMPAGVQSWDSCSSAGVRAAQLSHRPPICPCLKTQELECEIE